MTKEPKNLLTRIVAGATLTLTSAAFAAGETPPRTSASGEYDYVYRMTFRQLVLATLSVSLDLKGYDKYHCTYQPAVGPVVCDHMNTTSGQYEDLYQSAAESCARSEPCEGASLGIAVWDYMVSDRRLCKHLTTGSCVKEVLSEQDVRRELLDLLEFKRRINW